MELQAGINQRLGRRRKGGTDLENTMLTGMRGDETLNEVFCSRMGMRQSNSTWRRDYRGEDL